LTKALDGPDKLAAAEAQRRLAESDKYAAFVRQFPFVERFKVELPEFAGEGRRLTRVREPVEIKRELWNRRKAERDARIKCPCHKFLQDEAEFAS
jgi:hypothetical protein